MNSLVFKLTSFSLLVTLISTACAPQPARPASLPAGERAEGERTPAPTDIIEPTAVPYLFSDPTYDFTFEYPPDWTPQPFPDDPARGVFIFSPPLSTGPEPLIFAINVVVTNTVAANVKQAVDAEIAGLPNDVISHILRETVTVGGETAEQVIGLPSRSGDIEIFIVHRGKLYHILFQPYDPDNDSIQPYLTDALRVFNNFLASFQFK